MFGHSYSYLLSCFLFLCGMCSCQRPALHFILALMRAHVQQEPRKLVSILRRLRNVLAVRLVLQKTYGWSVGQTTPEVSGRDRTDHRELCDHIRAVLRRLRLPAAVRKAMQWVEEENQLKVCSLYPLRVLITDLCRKRSISFSDCMVAMRRLLMRFTTAHCSLHILFNILSVLMSLSLISPQRWSGV